MHIGRQDPLRHPTMLAAMLGALQAPVAGGDVTAFDSHLAHFLGDYPQASQRTVGLMTVLRNHLGPTGATWRDGVFGLHDADLAADRDRTLKAYAAAVGALFQDYGIDTGIPVAFGVAPSGRLVVEGEHPDAGQIESLLNGSPLLHQAATKVLQLTHVLEVMAMLQQGQSLEEHESTDLYQALAFKLSGDARELVADVELDGRLLASSALNAAAAALDVAITQFDAHHRQRLIDQRDELARWKAADERRRTLEREGKEADLADRLADKEAERRRADLHPELGHKPIFI